MTELASVSRLLIVLLLGSVAAGCGKGAQPEATPTPGSGPPTHAGTFAPEALSDFRCGVQPDGTWVASGSLSNRGTKPATYQVTVYVGGAGTSGQGKTQRIENLQKGGSVRFQVTGVVGPTTGPCNIQILDSK